MKLNQFVVLTVEQQGNTPAHLAVLEAIRQDLKTTMRREEVATVARGHGMVPYCGGCHVAIHAAAADGQLLPGRLAIVTGSGPDWS